MYRLKVTLDDIHPPSWRRLEIRGDWPIDFVATALRCLFGWTFSHASVLTIKSRQYGDPTGWVRLDPEQEFERRAKEIDKQGRSRRAYLAALDELIRELQAAASANVDDSRSVTSP